MKIRKAISDIQKIQMDFFEETQDSERMSFSEGLLLENIDYAITQIVVDNLFEK